MSCSICPMEVPKCKGCQHYRYSVNRDEYVCYYAQYIDKYNFVRDLGRVLNQANSNLVSCEYSREKSGEEYVTVFCQNGYKYKINVTANSLAAIGKEVFDQMANK